MTRPRLPRTPVVSSVVASVGYARAILDLEFRSGALYRYFAVPPSVFHHLLAADSKGAYFNRHVKDRFRYQRMA